MKDIIFITATKEKSIHLTFNTDYMSKLNNDNNYQCSSQCVTCNTESLAKVYNRALLNNKDKIVVFVHDDFLIEDLFVLDKIHTAIKLYDVIGLAGTVGPITVQKPALWHLMSQQTAYRGAVAHFSVNKDQRWMTSFGNTPDRVLLVDGVFMAVNAEKLLDNGVKFDESNPARFHYYDLDISLQANKSSLKVGVYPIWGTHTSHGLNDLNDKEFEAGQEWFIKKWSN